MHRFLSRFERRARYFMVCLTLLLTLGLGLFKAGLISTVPSYKEQAWYTVRDNAGFLITTEYTDEAHCRSAAKPPAVVCHSGKAMRASVRPARNG